MMNVVLISACEKGALKRTRAVLDRYAFRMGDSTWSTSITQEGLRSLHTDLRATASRNTAVLCLLRKKGGNSLAPLWAVGARSRFGEDWRTPVFVTTGKTRARTVDSSDLSWWDEIRRIAAISGIFHDLGKNNRFFAGKILEKKPVADPIRHEWISTHLIERLSSGTPADTLDAIWQQAITAARNVSINPAHPLLNCQDAMSAVLYCVATHHRLLNEENNARALDAGNMIRHVPGGGDDIGQQSAKYPSQIVNDVQRFLKKLQGHANGKSPLYWRAVAFYARAALILADHQVSSLRCQEHQDCRKMAHEPPFANTIIDKKGKRKTNQTLQWHLQSVRREAAAMANRLFHLEECLEGISPESLSEIDAPAEGRFAWQEDAALAVTRLRREFPQKPMLVCVISGTGSGKTRACARMITRAAFGGKVRFTALFNLRTLTLQTGSAYRDQLRIQESDMAVVIGDTSARKIHEAAQEADIQNEDGMVRDLGEDVLIQGAGGALPEWLSHFVRDNQHLKDLIAAPVFVSTADYLTPAGEPGAQARHILPMLRLMSSDLILDEIDNYDAQSLAAILRLVQLAGLFGRNVIASSATMTHALADALGRFYEHGARMRAELSGGSTAEFSAVVVSDLALPIVVEAGTRQEFSDGFRTHVHHLRQALAMKADGGEVPRKPTLITMDCNESSWFAAIARTAKEMHNNHAWRDRRSGKPLSVGLVRVAHIKTAMDLARYLRLELSSDHAKIACYHSQMFHGQRAMLERALDKILIRSRNPDAPADHPSIRAHMDLAQVKSGLFVVVATPVEEVGRDHDFDWAIIEPSSAQSIVQTGGRVMRHRTETPTHPNIGILQYNLRACRGEQVAFQHPGNETLDDRFSSHDLSRLVHWPAIAPALDARLRFDTDSHDLARHDEQALICALRDPAQRMTEDGALWMSCFTYEHWPLRSDVPAEEWRYDPDTEIWSRHVKTGRGWIWSPESNQSARCDWGRTEHHWLVPSLSEIVTFCEESGISSDWAFTVEVRGQDNKLSMMPDGAV